MTIKELEERTGMPRANIRFYEEEGLLCPKRLPNGYRDYSEDDAATLEKIKLLRQLQMDINTIRLLQQGELTLPRALFGLHSKLEGERTLAERALSVCRELERSGVEYGALEPDRWLQALEGTREQASLPPEAPPAPPELSEEERHWLTHRACEHPWMRLFARAFDYGLCSLAFTLLFVLGFRWYGYLDLGWFAQLLVNIGIYCVSILVEPVWLHFVGWTPGKWIFGLKVRDENGEKLSLAAARERAWRVAWQGDGLYIPFYSLWRNFRCYKDYGWEEDCPWDAEEGYRYTREDRKLYGLWYCAGQAVHIGLIVLTTFCILLPPNRGPLTVEEFCENYNNVIAKNRLDSVKLDSQGKWVTAEQQGGYTVVIDPFEGDTVWFDPEFTVEDGFVTAVTFRMESNESTVFLDDSRPLLGMMALSGADGSHGLFSYDYNGWVRAWEDGASEFWTDYTFTHRDIQVTQTVKAGGYNGAGPTAYSGILMAVDGYEPYVCRTVTISLRK